MIHMDALTRTYSHTGISLSECSTETTNTCDYCSDNGETVKAHFIFELKFRWVMDGPKATTKYNHGSLCANHLVAFMENYRDMAIEGADSKQTWGA